jgi:hypothetical protein
MNFNEETNLTRRRSLRADEPNEKTSPMRRRVQRENITTRRLSRDDEFRSSFPVAGPNFKASPSFLLLLKWTYPRRNPHPMPVYSHWQTMLQVTQRKCSHKPLRTFASTCHLIALIFLILVIIGNLKSRPVLRSTYFIKIGLANLIPLSVPNAQLIDSITRSIGLHDFYQVGLWNLC